MTPEAVDFDEFERRLRKVARPGQHVVMVGATGSGKSVLSRRVVPRFGRHIVIIDGKGGDDPGVGMHGFRLIRSWPPAEESNLLRALAPGGREPMHYHLAPKMGRREDLPKAAATIARALDDLFSRRGKDKVFTVYIDELGIVADPRKMGLGSKVEILHQQMRYRPGSVICSMQFPTWLPKAAIRETRHRFIFRVPGDEDAATIGAWLGRRRETAPMVQDLPRFTFLWQDIWSDSLILSRVPKELAR